MNRLSEMLERPEPAMAVVITEPLDDENIESIVAISNIFEFRADKFPNFEPTYLAEQIGRLAALPLLLTIRCEAEGGGWLGDEETRLSLFEHLIPYVDGVDIEIAAEIAPKVIKSAHGEGKTVIASSHNFDTTPSTDALEQELAKAQRLDADYVKFATTADNIKEYHRLANFTLEHATESLVVVAMGNYGPLSRIALPGLGSRLTYAFSGEVAVARGQLGYLETSELLGKLYPDY